MIHLSWLKSIHLQPIGFIERLSSDERDFSAMSKVVLKDSLADALLGIEGFSHIFIIFWLHEMQIREDDSWVHPSCSDNQHLVGFLATRAPRRPNPIGLTLVELINHENNVLWVKGLDAIDGTPVIDIKPYPDWHTGKCQVIVDYKIPDWLKQLLDSS
ncbi:MAG: tRNA (N6-threonylcarbamoyladenosine(37)-N6)-methyltransferase TrmO [Promethearchaeota archaeon]